jgi:hypothetical protein
MVAPKYRISHEERTILRKLTFWVDCPEGHDSMPATLDDEVDVIAAYCEECADQVLIAVGRMGNG